MTEIIASFIETGDYSEEGRGMVGAIRYLTQKDLLELKADADKERLSEEVRNAAVAERFILSGFSEHIDAGARVKLTRKDKAKNLKPYLKDIELLYSLRNRGNAEELAKLRLLDPKTPSSDYDLVILFRRTSEGKAFIRSIRLERRESDAPSKEGGGTV